jgi:hypothetical protein
VASDYIQQGHLTTKASSVSFIFNQDLASGTYVVKSKTGVSNGSIVGVYGQAAWALEDGTKIMPYSFEDSILRYDSTSIKAYTPSGEGNLSDHSNPIAVQSITTTEASKLLCIFTTTAARRETNDNNRTSWFGIQVDSGASTTVMVDPYSNCVKRIFPVYAVNDCVTLAILTPELAAGTWRITPRVWDANAPLTGTSIINGSLFVCALEVE